VIKLKVMVGETRDSLRELGSVTSHSYGRDGQLQVEGFVEKSFFSRGDAARSSFIPSGIQLNPLKALYDAGISQTEIDAATAYIKGLGFQDVEIHSPPDGLVMYVAEGSFKNCMVVEDALVFFRDGSLGSVGGFPPLNVGSVVDLPQGGEPKFLECENADDQS
jgi:hypothetical protein